MRRPRFEDRLERELIDAARRQAGGPGDRPPPRRRSRVAVGAAVALLTLTALGGGLVALRPHDDRRDRTAETPTAQAAPGRASDDTCAAEAGVGELELTSREMPSQVIDALAVLRRRGRAGEAAICPPIAIGPGVQLNPAEIRHIGYFERRAYGTLYVGTRWEEDRPQVCVFVLPYGVGTGGCGDALAALESGYSYAFTRGGVATYFFLVPDGVATVELRAADGVRKRLPVRDNVAFLLARNDAFDRWSARTADYALFDGDGRELSVSPVRPVDL